MYNMEPSFELLCTPALEGKVPVERSLLKFAKLKTVHVVNVAGVCGIRCFVHL